MTRNVWKTLLLVLLLPPLASAGASAGTPAGTAQPLFLTIVVDSSPASTQTWQQLKASACQAVDNLAPNDRVVILRAGNGEPSLHSDSRIQSPDLAGRQNLRQCIRDIRQVFPLSRADLAKAVATAFEHLGKHSEQYNYAVIVFSTGNLTEDQVRQVRRLAAAYRVRGWSLALLVQPGARRELFVAASQGEFDVMFLDKVNLAQWLEKARRQAPVGTQKPPEPPSPSQPDQPPEDIRPKPEPLPIPGRRGRPEPTGEPNSGQTDYTPPPVPRPPDIPPVPTLPPPPPPRPEPEPSEGKQPSWLRSILKNEHTLWIAVAGAVMVLIVLVVLVRRVAGRREDLPDLDEYGTTGGPQKLMCSAEDQQYDLGEEDSIDTLVIGKGPASAVPLPDDEELEEEHVKVFHRRRGYQIKNLAGQPIVVSGTVVNQGQKVDLLLPATIELTKKSRITLFREPVLPPEHDTQVTGETHDINNM